MEFPGFLFKNVEISGGSRTRYFAVLHVASLVGTWFGRGGEVRSALVPHWYASGCVRTIHAIYTMRDYFRGEFHLHSSFMHYDSSKSQQNGINSGSNLNTSFCGMHSMRPRAVVIKR